MAPLLSRLGVGGGTGGFGFGKRKKATGPFFSASGGNQTPITGLEPGNGYIYYTFTSPGTFTVSASSGSAVAELLIVGGGGGGGSNPNGYFVGGGGAGGLRNLTNIPISPGIYPITVGDGTPTGGVQNGASPPNATTSALGYSTRGGGQGTQYGGGDGSPPNIAGPGGSGGGHGVTHNYRYETGGTGNISGYNPPEGNPGGSGPTNSGQGGGGAGGAGSSGTGGAAVTLPDYAGSLIGIPSVPGTYSRGGAPSGPSIINNTGNGGNGPSNGSPGIVVIRVLV